VVSDDDMISRPNRHVAEDFLSDTNSCEKQQCGAHSGISGRACGQHWGRRTVLRDLVAIMSLYGYRPVGTIWRALRSRPVVG
jgi:hypothetical protein